MKIELLNLVSTFVLSIFYLFFFAKVQNVFFQKFTNPKKNVAVMILFISSLISASINLVYISHLSTNAGVFFLKNDNYLNAILYPAGYFFSMWLISFLIFRFSFLIVGMLSKENEEDELTKNNIELAIIHAVILISLTAIIAPSLVSIASHFIPYPELPF